MRFLATILLAGVVSTPASGSLGYIVSLGEPTERYGHAVLGDAVEYGALVLTLLSSSPPDEGQTRPSTYTTNLDTLRLPHSRVFEDIEVRSAYGVDPDREVFVVVESEASRGAQLAVYEVKDEKIRKRAATPHIGQRNRWLAPAAIADFDGDGINDIAYVETPHLAGILKIVTLRGDALVPIATPKPGFSNHRIGQDFITSDARTCDGITELLLPSLDWTTLMAARLENGEITARPLPHPPSREGIKAAKACNG